MLSRLILPPVILIVVVFARAKVKKKFNNVLNTGTYDFGVYRYRPLKGSRAIKKAKIGSFLADLFMWLTILSLSLRYIF